MKVRKDNGENGKKCRRMGELYEILAFFGALCMFFATLEYLFPKPIPFMRLGIANIPILLALDIFPFAGVMLITLIKVLGQGLINGTLASYIFLFSATGSITSALVMIGARKLFGSRISLVGISVLGALASNLVQTFFSVVFIFGSTAWIIIPYFLGVGFVSSIAVGLFAERFARKSAWLQSVRRYYVPVDS